MAPTVRSALVPTRGRPSRRANSAISSRSLTSDKPRGGPPPAGPKIRVKRPSAVPGSGRAPSASQDVTVRSPTPTRSASSRWVRHSRPRCRLNSSPVITHGGYRRCPGEAMGRRPPSNGRPGPGRQPCGTGVGQPGDGPRRGEVRQRRPGLRTAAAPSLALLEMANNGAYQLPLSWDGVNWLSVGCRYR